MTTLKDVVRDFVASLSVGEQKAVRGLILNPQVTPSLAWYKLIVAKYLQSPSATLLIEDIAQKYADEAVWRCGGTLTHRKDSTFLKPASFSEKVRQYFHRPQHK